MNIETILSKDNQTNLKNEYRVEVAKVYNNSIKMTDYCLSCAKFFAKFRNYIICFDKHRIDNDFWFGYSDCGQGMSYDENNNRVESIRNNLYEYFINKNVEHIDTKIKYLKNYIECNTNSQYIFYFVKVYEESNIIGNISMRMFYRNDVDTNNKLTIDEAKLYLELLLKYREIIVKQCNSYWKRYGASKIKLNTYWADR